MTEFLIYPDMLSLTRAAAERIVTAADAAMIARGRFTLALAGGGTPRGLYQLLASDEYLSRIDWPHVYFFWGDERCVPPESQDSNYHMARETLLNFVPVPMSNIFRMRGEIDPLQAADDYERVLSDFFLSRATEPGPQPRFDLVLLGLGDDAHTASLFPQTEPLGETEHWVVAHYVEKVDMWRITLTAVALNAAAQVIFLVTGAKKAEPLAAVFSETYSPYDVPAQLIQPAAGNLVWLVDTEAARLLY